MRISDWSSDVCSSDLPTREALAAEERKNVEAMRRQVMAEIASNAKLAKLAKHIHFVRTRYGMRIDLIDDADYSMFALGTTALEPEADELIALVADAIKPSQNPIMVRGHTDSLAYGNPANMNNWMLSSGRAEAVRRRLAAGGFAAQRFARIEGVAERQPTLADHPPQPPNPRVPVPSLYRRRGCGP